MNVYGKDIAGSPAEVTSFTNGSAVYFNPETGEKCSDYTVANSDTGNKSGCMKWYVFASDNENTTANLILDRNTTATVAWNSSGNNLSMGEVATGLTSDTATWQSSLNARLITANEIASITGHPTFDSTKTEQSLYYFDTNTKTQSATCQSGNTSGCSYSWLYDRTNLGCTAYGCLNNGEGTSTLGYWTSSPNVDNSVLAWCVYYYGNLNNRNIGSDSDYGVRPVITISKAKL